MEFQTANKAYEVANKLGYTFVQIERDGRRLRAFSLRQRTTTPGERQPHA